MDLTDDELIALVSDAPDPKPADNLEEDLDFDMVEAVVTAPPLLEMRQQLARFSAFMADNPQFTAQDELQRWTDKVARMLVSRVNHRQQQSITSYFHSA